MGCCRDFDEANQITIGNLSVDQKERNGNQREEVGEVHQQIRNGRHFA